MSHAHVVLVPQPWDINAAHKIGRLVDITLSINAISKGCSSCILKNTINSCETQRYYSVVNTADSVKDLYVSKAAESMLQHRFKPSSPHMVGERHHPSKEPL